MLLENCSILLLLCVAACSVVGHFSIVKPIRSRELEAERPTNDADGSWAYFPILPDGSDGGVNHTPQSFRGKANCLAYPPVKPYEVRGGSTLEIWFNAVNGAYHVGPCKVYLVRTNTMEVMALTDEVKDCVYRQHYVNPPVPLTVSIPRVKCSSCVIRVDVTATHIAPNYEYFNSCIDVKIV